MRKIKFRAKIKGDAGVYPVWVIDWWLQRAFIERACGNEWVPFEDIQKLMQFTGLLDKVDTEIFEGDVVYWEYRDSIKDKIYSGKFEVVIPEFYYDLRAEETTYEEGDDLEVIGNVHESPDPLEAAP